MCGVLQHYEIMQKVKLVKFVGRIKFTDADFEAVEDRPQPDKRNIGKAGFCSTCGRELVGKKSKFCSIQCVSAARHITKAKGTAKTCPVCKTPFKAVNKNQMSCSHACGRVLFRKTCESKKMKKEQQKAADKKAKSLLLPTKRKR